MLKKKTAKSGKEKMDTNVDSSFVSKFLKRASLGGILEEAVVDFDGVTIEAVDPTNSLFMKVSGDKVISRFDLGTVGIGALSLMCKYLDAYKGNISLKAVGNRLHIKAKGHGELKYLMADPDCIASALADKKDVSVLVKPCKVRVNLTKKFCDDLSLHIRITGAKSVSFEYKDGFLVVSGGLESEHQFSIPAGKTENLGRKDAEDFTVQVFSNHLDQIFNVLEWPEDEKPYLCLAPNHPLLVLQDEDNVWALLPLVSTVSEE